MPFRPNLFSPPENVDVPPFATELSAIDENILDTPILKVEEKSVDVTVL